MKENTIIQTLSDSTPVKSDSVWIGSGYGWTHHTYHWIPAHWEAIKKSKTKPVTIRDARVLTDTSATETPVDDSTTIVNAVPATATGRIWIKGHRELIHNNYVWVSGHWQAVAAATK